MPETPNNKYVVPSDWCSDPLAIFLEKAQQNVVATFSNLRPQYDALSAIDNLYCTIVENLNQTSEFISGFFLIRTHSSFRGAVRLCLSGQLAEAYMVLRGALESALYGLYVADDTDRQRTWLGRHESDAGLRQVKREFTIRNVLLHLQSIDATTHGVVQSLYDRAIDLGGHPNERAVTSQIKTEGSGSEFKATAEYFICGNLPHQLSLKSAAQAGVCCLDIFFHVFRDRFRILGIDERMDQLRKGL